LRLFSTVLELHNLRFFITSSTTFWAQFASLHPTLNPVIEPHRQQLRNSQTRRINCVKVNLFGVVKNSRDAALMIACVCAENNFAEKLIWQFEIMV
jgi:hypothetical protein